MSLTLLFQVLKGSASSGNWGHAGRVGKRGGSVSRNTAMSISTGRDWQERQQAKKKPAIELPVNKATEALAERYVIDRFDGKEKAEKMLGQLKGYLKDAPVCSRVPVEVLEKILDEGKFKNQHETGTSRGTLNPNFRKESEQNAFGTQLEKPSELPIYGYFATKDNGFSPGVASYGGIKVEFKPSVKDRSTVTAGDSLYPFSVKEAVGTPANNPRLASLDSAFEDSGKLTTWSYMEAQIHGPLTTKDISKVYIDARYDSASLLEKLNAQSIPYELTYDASLGDE